MLSVTLTAKRQATFPKNVCDELGVQPGDQLDLERRVVDGKRVWVIKPHRTDWSWFGAAVPMNPDASHDLDDIRASIGRSRASEERDESDA